MFWIHHHRRAAASTRSPPSRPERRISREQLWLSSSEETRSTMSEGGTSIDSIGVQEELASNPAQVELAPRGSPVTGERTGTFQSGSGQRRVAPQTHVGHVTIGFGMTATRSNVGPDKVQEHVATIRDCDSDLRGLRDERPHSTCGSQQ